MVMPFSMQENVNFQIMTDSNSDLPKSYLEEHRVGVLYLGYTMKGITYGKDKIMPDKEFYEAMRAGELPTTSSVNFDQAKQEFEYLAEQGKDILYISFSSALSSSFSAASAAAQEVAAEYPQRKILVVDSLCASLGEGLLVHKLVKLRDEGASAQEAADWAEQNKLHICHNFTVDDLFHLHRGGRVSKTSAVLGTLINIKPVLHVDDEGKLIPIGKVRGRKNSLKALVENMEKAIAGYDNPEVFISHGDCLEDAQLVADMVKERFGIENVLINYVGPSIGAHSGPGTVALFFMGEKR